MFDRIREDIRIVYERDPAARNAFEIITAYPGMQAIWAHRINHRLHGWGLKWLARWLSGLVGTAVLTTMSWYTLKIPNTQSATGILYVAVICVFLGELTSQILSGSASYPL